MPDEPPPLPRKHPLRRWWVWVLMIVVPLILILLVSLLIYNHVAKSNFEKHLASLEAMGETLEVDLLTPPQVADAESNFARAKIILSLRSSDGEIPEPFSEMRSESIPGFAYQSKRKQIRYAGPYRLGEQFDSLSNDEAADRVLRFCEPFTDTLRELSDAAERPECNFERDYDLGLSLLMPELKPLQNATKLLQLRALAYLEKGNPSAAADDLITILRLGRHYNSEPSLISQFIGIAYSGIGSSILRSGLSEGQWDSQSLEHLLSEWPDFQFQQGLLRAFRLERAIYANYILDLANADSAIYRVQVGAEIAALRLPDGFLYENATMLSTLIQEEILTDPSGIRRENTLPLDSSLDSRVEAIQLNRLQRVRFMFAALAIPAYDQIGLRGLRSEALYHHAIIALHLEQIKVAIGSYPPALPKIPEEVTLDHFSGLKFQYEIFDDDTYQLYSVGPNLIDDGGLLQYKHEKGDWVWRLHLPEDFDYDEYRGQ